MNIKGIEERSLNKPVVIGMTEIEGYINTSVLEVKN